MELTPILKIDIGCGRNKKEGFLGIDIVNLPGVDFVLNMEKDPIPLPNQSVGTIFSSHFLEHILSVRNFFAEIGRVCVDGAEVEIWTPWGFHNTAFFFAHKSYLTEEIWKNFCITSGDSHLTLLGNVRWQLHHINYVIPRMVHDEISQQGFSMDFALRYFRNISSEFGVFITICRDKDAPPVIPDFTYSFTRPGERYPLRDFACSFKAGIPYPLLVQVSLQKIYQSYPPFRAILFGTGELSDHFYRVFSRERIFLDGYFDNDHSRWGKWKNGLRIMPPSLVPQIKVIIASSFDKEISKQLTELGYEEENIVHLR
jgi:hypothetical protein